MKAEALDDAADMLARCGHTGSAIGVRIEAQRFRHQAEEVNMNNEARWTPGPWYVAEATAYPSVKSSAVQGKRRGDKGIVTMYRSDAEHSANAHLIAAAPELYGALKVAHDNLYALLNDPEIGPEARKLYDFEDVAAMARPLAKARGEQS